MARSASVRSASLGPAEAALADRLAAQIAHGSFTELTRHLLVLFGAPVSRRLDDLEAAGIDPTERLVMIDAAPTDQDPAEFYRPGNWPAQGPQAAPRA